MSEDQSLSCRAATLTDLILLITNLNQRNVDYMLIGGYALATYGYQRATTDIDILFPATVESGVMVREVLMLLPDKVAQDIDPEWFSEGENIRVADEFLVDIMLNANGQTYESLLPYAQTVNLDGLNIKTVSLEGLLLTKQTMREKDIADRILLETAISLSQRQTMKGC